MQTGKPLSASAPVAELLQQAAAALGLAVDARQQYAFQTYLAQLQRWNATYNLTAIRDPDQMLIQHIFDSLAIIAPLRRKCGAHANVLDAGSGAGLPGVVIAIMQPQWHVTCVDAVEKKTVFVQQMAGVLGLENLKAHHVRLVESDPHRHHARSVNGSAYTCAVSRAFASLKDFASLAGPQLGENGVLAAMKGQIPEEEIRAVSRETDWCVTAVEPLAVPLLRAQRCLVWLQRKPDGQHNKESHAPE